MHSKGVFSPLVVRRECKSDQNSTLRSSASFASYAEIFVLDIAWGHYFWRAEKFWGGVHPGGTPRNFGGFCPKSPFWGQNGKPTNVPCGCTYCTPKSRAEKYFTIPSKSCKNFGSKNLKIFERGVFFSTDLYIFWAPGIWAPWYIYIWKNSERWRVFLTIKWPPCQLFLNRS